MEWQRGSSFPIGSEKEENGAYKHPTTNRSDLFPIQHSARHRVQPDRHPIPLPILFSPKPSKNRRRRLTRGRERTERQGEERRGRDSGTVPRDPHLEGSRIEQPTHKTITYVKATNTTISVITGEENRKNSIAVRNKGTSEKKNQNNSKRNQQSKQTTSNPVNEGPHHFQLGDTNAKDLDSESQLPGVELDLPQHSADT